LGVPPRARKTKEKDETGFYEVYANFARLFRGWLVAYGVGAPVVFVSQEAVMKALKAATDGWYVVLAYLAGSILQIMLVWLYKLCMWWAYLEEMGSLARGSYRYRFVDWFTNIFWVEGVVDFITVGLFVYATGRILFILAA
jgi:hypothetical protein